MHYCSDSIAPAELRELAAILRQDRHAQTFLRGLLPDARRAVVFDPGRTCRPHGGHAPGGRSRFSCQRKSDCPSWVRLLGQHWHVVAGARRVPLAGAMASLTQIVPISYLVTAVLLGVALAVAWRFPSARAGATGGRGFVPAVGAMSARSPDWSTAAGATRPRPPITRPPFVRANGSSWPPVCLKSPTTAERRSFCKDRPPTGRCGRRLLVRRSLDRRASRRRAESRPPGGPGGGRGSRSRLPGGTWGGRGQASGDGRPFFAIRTPTAVLTSSRECSGRDIPSSTEFGVVVVSPEVSRAYVFRGRIAAQAPGGGRGDQAVPVDENQAVWVQQADEGRKATIVREEGRPNPNLFARRGIVPLGGDLKQVAWLKDVGTGQQRHFVAVGSGKDLDLPSKSRMPSGTVVVGRACRAGLMICARRPG